MKLKGDIEKIEDLDKNVSAAVQFILLRVGQNVLVNNAKINAPFLSGDLRDSLGMKADMVESGYIIVWSDKPYSRRREYENNKNPQTKYYLWRAYSEHIPEIRETIITSLSDKLR